jgi:hypothetical protein
MTVCARGCVQARHHLDDCEDADACKGCLPLEAAHGLLCYACHSRLVSDLHDAPFQHYMLGLAATPSMSQELSDTRSPGEVFAPSPLNLAAYSAATDLSDVLSGWVEMLCDQYDYRGPTSLMTRDGIENPQGMQLNPRWSRWCHESVWCDPPRLFEVRSACKWLLAQLEHLEACPGIGDLANELSAVMAQAHALAPWREQAARLNGIECPCCHAVALVRYGGDADVTCQKCKQMIPPARYAIWTRRLAAERESRPA